MRRIILLFIVCIFMEAGAQPERHQIKLLAKTAADGVWLRWAPADFIAWQLGNKHGYAIERYTLDANGALQNEKTISLNPLPIRPLTSEALHERAKTSKEAEALEELIYGDASSPATENPAALLEQSEDMNNRFGMALLICDFSLQMAKAAGLFWKDTTAVKGTRHIYKVKLTDTPFTKEVEPAVAVVDVNEAKPLQAFKDVSAAFADRKVTISWSLLTHRGFYTAYIIEKSDDGTNFKPISDLPYVPMSQFGEPEEAHFVDSLESNDKKYHYRVKGITPFAETGPPSNVVSGLGKIDLSGMVTIQEIKRDTKNSVVIRWEFPAGHEPAIGGFKVSRASKAEGPYIDITPQLLQARAREATDPGLSASAYYQVKVVDREGKEITHSLPYFLHVEDNVPPLIPTGLSGTTDKDGIVTLNWNPNNEKDLLGYRIFSSNDLKNEFVEVTREIVSTNTYTDTITVRVLNKNIYYKVTGVDNSYNTSNFSAPCRVARPDVIAPVKPVFTKTEVKSRAISLQWTNSISDDVVIHTLYRTTVSDNDKSMTIRAGMIHWGKDKSEVSYLDNTVQQGKVYQYEIEASDSAGNVSTAVSERIKVELDLPEDVTDFKAIINRNERNITLKWNYSAATKKCILYRRKNEEPFSLYQVLDGEGKEFIDKQIIVSNTYSYRIQLVLETNSKTKLSETLKVPF